MFGKNYLLPMFLSRMQNMALPGQGRGCLFPTFRYAVPLAQIINSRVDYTNIRYAMSVHRRQKSMIKRNKKDRLSVLREPVTIKSLQIRQHQEGVLRNCHNPSALRDGDHHPLRNKSLLLRVPGCKALCRRENRSQPYG